MEAAVSLRFIGKGSGARHSGFNPGSGPKNGSPSTSFLFNRSYACFHCSFTYSNHCSFVSNCVGSRTSDTYTVIS